MERTQIYVWLNEKLSEMLRLRQADPDDTKGGGPKNGIEFVNFYMFTVAENH